MTHPVYSRLGSTVERRAGHPTPTTALDYFLGCADDQERAALDRDTLRDAWSEANDHPNGSELADLILTFLVQENP